MRMAGLPATFDLLASTANEAADSVLLAALDSTHREARDAGLAALLQRRNPAAELNILRRWPEMSERWKSQIAQRPDWLSSAIRATVVHRDSRLFETACTAAVFTHNYDSLDVLIAAASDVANPLGRTAATATLELSEQILEELASPRDYRIRRDPQQQRSYVLPALERAAMSLATHGRREVLEAFLLLTSRENAALKKLLQTPQERNFTALAEVLATSPRPGIERLLLSYLDDPHAPLAALQIIGRRGDVSFIRQLTRKIGAEPSPTIRANLKRMDSISWIIANFGTLDALREAEQPGAVHLAAASSIPRGHALDVITYILKHGKVAARRIGAEALADFPDPEAGELVLRLLDDDDPLVRTAAARQLRPRNLPGAIERLVALLDSRHPDEREAAREGLAEFTLDRYAANFDDLTPAARISAGALVRRVDETALPRIRSELSSAARGSRKTALEWAVALDVVGQLEGPIAALLQDEDQYLRIDAIRALTTNPTPQVLQYLRDALLDPYPLVQQAAEAAVREVKGQGDTVALAVDGARDTQPMHVPLIVPAFEAAAEATV